jgi:hypothetical protein
MGPNQSIEITQRYVHPSPEAVERAFERLQLSGASIETEPKVLPPATVFATVGKAVLVTD